MAHGVTDTALRYWGSRLAEEEDEHQVTPSRKSAARAPAPSRSPPLARVVRPGEAPDGRITVMVGKAAIVVEPGFQDAHLRAVVRALSEVG
jgi:transposase-like protein